MKAKLRFVYDDYRGYDRLQKERRETDKAKRAIRKCMGTKVSVCPLPPPLKANLFFVRGIWTKFEIFEERGYKTNGLNDLAIMGFVSIPESEKVRGNV